MKTDSKPQELPTAEIVIRLRKQAEVCKEIDSMVARIDSTIDPERGEHETLFGMAADRLEAADDVFVLITKANERLTKHLEAAEATIKAIGELPRYYITTDELAPNDEFDVHVMIKPDELQAILDKRNE